MTIHVQAGGIQRSRSTRLRVTKGYAKHRRDYDARRRARKLDTESSRYADICRADPCSYCPDQATDNDHIEGLDSGGADQWDNFTGACKRCNAAKREKRLLLFLLGRPIPRGRREQHLRLVNA